ncbi:serine hydrolase domain-containing protein [Paenibacillus sp. 481]|uniref:serine hydrolase domain-containing protein n=1 Tax=Paenibacillus sp. 481 TaxID=2835869 RepID=UPI001E48323C|nr:serine hydrolase domain-containing protein [Paenibacillus sp. 481]UHA71883.1 beta-lactamase family protein [Paenibacillus sp. 481]
MKKITLVLFIFLLVAPSFAAAAEGHDKTQQINTFMKKALEDYQIPGASLVVVHKGQTIFQDSWGKMSDGSPVTTDTTFLIGSVSKPLTALAVMMLAEDGKIKLDEPIDSYLPSFTYQTDSTKPITVRHLLEQTSGISAYDGLQVTDQAGRDQKNAITKAVAQLSGVKLRYVPGEVYEYNSANYLLLGALIEQVSKQSFSQFMSTQIFSPLGMNNTSADYVSAVAKGYVPGYESWFGRPIAGDGGYDHAGAPYGYMSSSASDLAKFITFMLKGGPLLTEQGHKQLQMPPADGRRYGFGWHFPRSGEKYPYHTGATPEYKSEVFFIPEKELGAVLVTNKYHELEALAYLSMMEGIRSIMNGQNPELAEMNVNAQWITLGVVLLITMVCVWSLIRLKRKASISKKVWMCTGALSVIVAVGLIPLLTTILDVPWGAVGHFMPDIEFLLYSLIAILAVQGLVTFFFIAGKKGGHKQKMNA